MIDFIVKFDGNKYTPWSLDGVLVSELGTFQHAYDFDYTMLIDLYKHITKASSARFGGSAIYQVVKNWLNVNLIFEVSRDNYEKLSHLILVHANVLTIDVK